LRVLEVGNVLARDEVELSAVEHEAGKIAHHWLGLYMKIAEHNIGAPAAEQLVKSVSTLAHRSAMAPPARRALALISCGRKLTLGPCMATATRRAEVTLAGVTPDQVPEARQ
jgi:hypothetical protein